MNVSRPSFSVAWELLTKEKGWYKPIIVLALVNWIPIVGQIAVMGYALEWARLIAWGVDCAPKQRDIKYGKVLGSGFRAFMVTITLGLLLALVDSLLFGTSTALLGLPVWSGLGTGMSAQLAWGAGVGGYLVMLVFNLLVGTFIQAAALRAVIYDQFAAGWRLDRLAQMVMADFGGFARTYLVSLIAGFINWAYSALLTLLTAFAVYGGAMGMLAYGVVHGMNPDADLAQTLVRMLFQVGPSALLLVILLAIALGLVGMFIGAALQLVSTAALGQWFRAFDVARWGTSNAPLPTGVPHYEDKVSAESPASAPRAPEEVSQVDAAVAAENTAAVADVVDAEVEVVVEPETSEVDGRDSATDFSANNDAEKPAAAPAPWDEVLGAVDAGEPDDAAADANVDAAIDEAAVTVVTDGQAPAETEDASAADAASDDDTDEQSPVEGDYPQDGPIQK